MVGRKGGQSRTPAEKVPAAESAAAKAPPAQVPQAEPNPQWTARRLAASRSRPKKVRLLLVAASPPSDLACYFYFEEAGSEDPLYERLVEVLFEELPRPGHKDVYLRQLRRRGVFVTELKPDAPRANEPLGPYVPWFALNNDPAGAEHVVLIGEDVYAAARRPLADAGFPVVEVKVPEPAPGKEPAFRRELRTALVRAGLESLIRPLTPAVRASLDEPTPGEGEPR